MPHAVVVGNLCRDDILHPDGSEAIDAMGGSAFFGSLGARMWTPSVGMVARIGRDYPQSAIERLRDAGIDTAGVVPFDGPSVYNRMDYRDARGRRVTRLAGTPMQNSPRPGDWPSEWSDVRAVHLASMPVAIQAEWVDFLRTRDVAISLDPHLASCKEDVEALQATIAQADFFIPSDLELRMIRPDSDLEVAAREVDRWTRRGAIITCGASGVFAPRHGGWLPPCHVECVVDQTGAGDSYATTFIWAWVETGDAAEAHRRGAAAAAFMIEGEGALHTLEVNRERVEERAASLRL